MKVVLVDTSVWINVFKGIETNSSVYLKNENLNISVATCPVIVQEVLQGIVSDRDYTIIANKLSNMNTLPANAYNYAYAAANLYRELRKKGITIRKPNDCLIAIYAIQNKIPLLHDDKDFTNIAAFSDLKVLNI